MELHRGCRRVINIFADRAWLVVDLPQQRSKKSTAVKYLNANEHGMVRVDSDSDDDSDIYID